MYFFNDKPYGQTYFGVSNHTKVSLLPYGRDNHEQALRAKIPIKTECSLGYVESLTSRDFL